MRALRWTLPPRCRPPRVCVYIVCTGVKGATIWQDSTIRFLCPSADARNASDPVICQPVITSDIGGLRENLVAYKEGDGRQRYQRRWRKASGDFRRRHLRLEVLDVCTRMSC